MFKQYSRVSMLLSMMMITLSPVVADAAPRTLTIYTYDSFISEWGPGPLIQKGFESQCDCQLKFVALDSSASLLNRVQMEGKSSEADIVLGLDTNLMALAEKTGLLAPAEVSLKGLSLPVKWDSPLFVPYDYGYFAFIYDTEQLAEPPQSLAELIDTGDELKVIITDPRTSTPGLGLLLWMKQVFGDQAAARWQDFQDNILTVTKGWSEAYFSLFMNGEAPMVLSYTTSPAYHMAVEQTDRYQAAAFSEGHYLQVEVAAMLKNADDPALARKFLRYLISPEAQAELPLTNVMYPVVDLGDELPAEFDRLVNPVQTLMYTPDEVASHRKTWVEEWLDASTR